MVVSAAGFRPSRKEGSRVGGQPGWECREGWAPAAEVVSVLHEPRGAGGVALLPKPESDRGCPRGGAGGLVRVMLRGSQLEVALPPRQRRGPRIASGRRGDKSLPQQPRGLEP